MKMAEVQRRISNASNGTDHISKGVPSVKTSSNSAARTSKKSER